MTTYYVYVYLDPRKHPPEPMYVGKGRGKRRWSHLTRATNPALKGKIDRIRAAGLEPEVHLWAQGLSCNLACQIERDLIARWGRLDLQTGSLCNLTDGGEGTEGRITREETRQLMSAQRKGKKQTPAQLAANRNRQPQTEETRNKKSLANKGHRRHTSEQIETIVKYNRTRVISDETRQKWSQKRRGVKQTTEHIRKVQESIVRNRALRKTMSEQEWSEYRKAHKMRKR